MTESTLRKRPTRGQYKLRIKGHLGDQWAGWLGSQQITHHADGTTVLTGDVADHAALYGLLRKVRDLGMPLLSLTYDEPNETHHLSRKER
ncbi:MAG: hypothetical protein KDD73_00825 [Anaerolineales bacterium]|nr:hypothetical protein [Anaerolineales bacterium]MCB9129094.1 hypothetical protein [Ardenticatenales bacterium]